MAGFSQKINNPHRGPLSVNTEHLKKKTRTTIVPKQNTHAQPELPEI